MTQSQPISGVRTQIYLPHDVHKHVKEIAQKRGVSMARIIREAVEEKMPVKNKKDEDKAWEELMKMAGFIKGPSPQDMATNHGKYRAEAVYKDMIKNRIKR